MIALAANENGLAKEIGQRIRDRRKQLDLTQEQAAERSELSQQYIACVESGTTGLGDESIIKLSWAVGISADYILFGSAGVQDQNRLLELLQPLNGKELMGLEEIIQVYLKACGHKEW